MKRCLLSLLAFACISLVLPAATIPFPHEDSDLKPDPTARFGKLPNGMRYVLRTNKEPKDRASLRLLVEAGAIHETEKQLGLAHFLEHMAFNGSDNYPSEDMLIKFFQRMGMNFGGDTNASTWFTRTLYLLEMPDTKEATLGEGIKVFKDYAGGLLLKADEIDKERGIILSEKRTRDSVGYRTYIATNNFLLNGTMFQKRDVIGTTEVLQTVPREEFVDFYNTWYRPEAMALVIVGDIDVAAVEKQVVAAFTPLNARGPERAQPNLGKVPEREGTQAFYHHESEAPNTNVMIATMQGHLKEKDTAAQRLKYLPRMLAYSMINRRLSVLAKKENAPFTGGSASTFEGYNFYQQSVISLNCRGDQWVDAMGVADQELRRALEHGFQGPELKEVVANFRNSLEQSVKTAPTRRSDDIAGEIADSLLDREVWTSPEDDLKLYGPALDKTTPADCLAALREAWSAPHRLVMVTGNAKVTEAVAAAPATPAEKAITSVYEKSRAVLVTPPAAMEEAKWAYTDFGAPGKVAKREHVADLDVHLLTFENGVRLNLKKTDFESNRIRMSVRVGSGALTEPKDKQGLSFYTGQTYTEGGLGKHSVDDLRRILAGKTVGAGFGPSSEAFVLNGTTNREDLTLQMQLITARMSDPGFRPEAARQAAKAIDQIYLSFAHTAGGPFTLEVARLLASGDHRFGLPAKEEVLKRNLGEVKAWVTPELQRGPIEVAIVGDIDLDATIEAVAKTLGALPKRDARRSLDALKNVKFPAQPFMKDYAIDTEIPKGNVALYWPTTDGREIHRARRLNMLSEVFSDRLRVKVREELGDAYSPGAGSAASDVYPGYGYMQASVTVDPPRAKQVADIIVEIANDLAEKGVTEDELDRAKKPVLTSLRESARTNQYWLGNVLSRAQEKPEALDWCRSRYADNEAITVAELNALAKEYLSSSRASRVIVIPQGKTASGSAPVTGEAPAKKAE
ncbi:MAG TPA: insulinase family protein [Opitutaceae bacterium]|nr:insulinase family protein [Opitutaceae bacterium]